jgi:hypothetical protein
MSNSRISIWPRGRRDAPTWEVWGYMPDGSYVLITQTTSADDASVGAMGCAHPFFPGIVRCPDGEVFAVYAPVRVR